MGRVRFCSLFAATPGCILMQKLLSCEISDARRKTRLPAGGTPAPPAVRTAGAGARLPSSASVPLPLGPVVAAPLGGVARAGASVSPGGRDSEEGGRGGVGLLRSPGTMLVRVWDQPDAFSKSQLTPKQSRAFDRFTP